MTKAELKKMMKKYNIIECELEDIIFFVENLLHFKATETEKNEPYAINSIAMLKDAAYEVWNLLEYIDDIMEE